MTSIMMRNNPLPYLCIVLSATMLALVSCKKEDDGGDVLPSNLEASVSVNEGTVQVTAMADNAHFYSFTFSENGSPVTVENESV